MDIIHIIILKSVLYLYTVKLFIFVVNVTSVSLMAGALFNILIPTNQHEIHLSQCITCDCSTKTKRHNNKKTTYDDTIYDDKRPDISSPIITMEKVSTYLYF